MTLGDAVTPRGVGTLSPKERELRLWVFSPSWGPLHPGPDYEETASRTSNRSPDDLNALVLPLRFKLSDSLFPGMVWTLDCI